MLWKVLLCDDEAVIVKGLRRLIDWEALGVEVVGEATDGETAAELIRQTRPDLVVSDIRMPRLSGLDVMAGVQAGEYAPKFIFISGYGEFEYARRALAGGAVDYLLKPVSAEALEKSVRRALGLMEHSSADALFRQPSGQVQEFFAQLTANREFAGSELYDKFTAMLEGRDGLVFRGLCLGLYREDEAQLDSLPYEKQLLQRFMVFNTARDLLERGGHACFLRKDEGHCWLMGIFRPGERAEQIVAEVLEAAAQRTGRRLRAGLGRECAGLDELPVTYDDALRAFDLYYFDQREILCWDGSPHPLQATNQGFSDHVKKVFHSIISKSEDVLDDVDQVLDDVADLHWGNRMAAYNRTMLFTGDICQQLYDNRLLTGSFNQRQDELQHRLEGCGTFAQLRERLRDYYRELLPDVYRNARGRSTREIVRVQRYVEEHYDQEISLKVLAELACVSTHYFSAYFKAETGQNYKAFLTRVRMERAMELVINSDLKTYEIAERVGYNNVRRFVDAFRAAYGMSPLDYRKLHKK